MPKATQARQHTHLTVGARDVFRIGFVPMIDCAPLIAAQELGLFRKYDLNVRLTREVGWGTIREKLTHGELDAAHAPASMAFQIRCGIGVVPRACLTAVLLSLNGSAITLSNELWDLGVRDAATLKELIDRERGRRVFSFGAVLELSTQNIGLRRWLRSGGIDPDRDVQIPMIPSPLIHRRLAGGHIDGYCVAEPWNSISALDGTGWVVSTCADIDPQLPEKVLLVLESFHEAHSDEHLAMAAAIIEAGQFCDDPEARPELVRLLSRAAYLDVPPALLRNSLIGPFHTGRSERDAAGLVTFHRDGASIPDRAKGRRIFREMGEFAMAKESRSFRADVIPRIFREDLYRLAHDRISSSSPLPCNAHAARPEALAISA